MPGGARREFDKAISDCTEAIRIDPRNTSSRYHRALVAWLTGRDANAIDGIKEVIEVGGSRDKYTAYAAILGNCTARRSKHEDEARQFLTDFKDRGDTTAWPYPIVRYLLGEIDGPELLKQATDNGKLTESRCYLGLDLVLKRKPEEAISHFH